MAVDKATQERWARQDKGPESPLLKLRQALEWAGNSGSLAEARRALAEAEERWLLERELHKQQVVKIRKQRHEYIMYLRTQLWLIAEEVEHVGQWPWKGRIRNLLRGQR